MPLLEGLPGADDPVFVGGPVQPEAFMVLAEFDDVAETRGIMKDLGFMPADTPSRLTCRSSACASSAGYSGWGAGQLEAELAEPSWIVVDAETDDGFAPTTLWRTVLHGKGIRSP